jgi:V/A-type H+-transporting ATPase subunit I
MAIVPIVHATIIGQATAKAACLEELQGRGFLHIIAGEAAGRGVAGHGSRAMAAYHYLKNCPGKRRQAQEENHFDQQRITDEALAIKEKSLVLEEERDYLQARIKNLEPWGNFIMPPLAETRGYRFWFYIVPLYALNRLAAVDHVWQCVYKDNRDGYIVVIAPEEPDPRLMPTPRIHTGSKSLAEVKGRLSEVDAELEDLRWRRTGLTRWLTILARQLATVADKGLLDDTAAALYDDGELFSFEAWLPEHRLAELHGYSQEAGLLLQARAPRADETPPTLLENPPAWSGGETLVEFYTTPAYHLWDPSRVVFLSFVLFFAMIIADAGYGLLLGLIWLLGRRRFSCTSAGLCRLFGAMVAATVLYGVLVGSYFGVGPEPHSLLARLQILDVRNKEQMMLLSIALGVGHLLMANSGNFFLARRPGLALQPLGWVLALVGGFAWWLGAVKMPGTPLLLVGGGRATLALGGLVVLFGSSNRPLGRWQDLLLRLADGFVALTGFSKVFGDVLSYLRLFALGLASAQLAVTFNNLAGDAMANLAGVGTLAAICILTVGHGLNLLLAVMSGVVHGLRLNYIEFFNWGLGEEGYAFRPFRKRRIGIWNQL